MEYMAFGGGINGDGASKSKKKKKNYICLLNI
jgi:hypothetical protein